MTAISERDGFAIFIDSFEGLDYKIKLKLLSGKIRRLSEARGYRKVFCGDETRDRTFDFAGYAE